MPSGPSATAHVPNVKEEKEIKEELKPEPEKMLMQLSVCSQVPLFISFLLLFFCREGESSDCCGGRQFFLRSDLFIHISSSFL